jgi:hypothetical protein
LIFSRLITKNSCTILHRLIGFKCPLIIYRYAHIINRLCGVTFLPEEGPGWFPGEELKEHYGLGEEYEVSKLERYLLGFRNDGREGIIYPTVPMYVQNREARAKEELDDEDEEHTAINITAAPN